jgi:hypothetical protein
MTYLRVVAALVAAVVLFALRPAALAAPAGGTVVLYTSLPQEIANEGFCQHGAPSGEPVKPLRHVRQVVHDEDIAAVAGAAEPPGVSRQPFHPDDLLGVDVSPVPGK